MTKPKQKAVKISNAEPVTIDMERIEKAYKRFKRQKQKDGFTPHHKFKLFRTPKAVLDVATKIESTLTPHENKESYESEEKTSKSS